MSHLFRAMTITVFSSLLLLLSTQSLFADDSETGKQDDYYDDVLARQGGVTLTQGELDAQFSKIPSNYRLAFIRDGERVSDMVQNLLRGKLVAADARANQFEDQKLVSLRMQSAAEKELAEAWALEITETAPDADYKTLAYEHYLANPDEYMSEHIVDVSHILISRELRDEAEALELVNSLRRQLDDEPGLFEAMVMEHSDDPSKVNNKGRFPRMKKGEMVKPFELAAFSLENSGDISEPVETDYGYHIIVMNNNFPPRLQAFEDVQDDAMAQAKERYLTSYRAKYLGRLLSQPITIEEGALDAMVRRHFGENLELAPDYQE